ncbi:MAG TPA: YceI family protein [Polyangiaceae bacterium]|nr:YceI family protein [Polyangiaceae bacterium]
MTTRWSIDPMHSSVTFAVRHLLITTVRGAFDQLAGTLLFEPGRLESASAEVEVAAASIGTRQAQRDEHLRSSDFFDAANHPTIRFRSTRFSREEVVGEMTLRGMTREMRFALTEWSDALQDHRGMTRIGVSATGRLKRSEFGMTYNRVLESGGLALADEVELTIDLSLVREG